MKKYFIFLIILLSWQICSGQTPHGFNYQAVARDGMGNILPNTDLTIKIGLLTDTVNNVYVWEEKHQVSTNLTGVFSLVVGTGSKIQGSATSFDEIEWPSLQLYLRTKVVYNSVERTMGTTRLWSVPYSIVSEETKGISSGSKLEIIGENDESTDALFEVKRKDGQTVFAVYNDAVHIYVPDQTDIKGPKGGFAIGGFGATKGFSQQYFRVTPDSIRLYINDIPGKGPKGGFAIGGFGATKAPEKRYMSLYGSSTVDTIREASQIMWYPNKEAFLAGRIDILSPDSVGKNSFSTGYKTKAIGDYSHAMGYESIARGNYSTAIGRSAIADTNSFALGNFARAFGNDSYAIGSGSIASAPLSFALGVQSQSTGNASVSMGFKSVAAQPYSVAIGFHAFASGYDSYAIGSHAEANGERSFAIGSYGLNEDGSTNINRATWAPGYYSLAFGMGAQATRVGAMALGVNATAAGDQSVSIGFGTSAEAQYSTALGYRSIAHGFKSISIGGQYNLTFRKLVWQFNATDGNWTFVPVTVTLDKQNISSGEYAIAIGNGNFSADGGLTLGNNNEANAFGSVAIGHSNVADSAFSFSAGFSNKTNALKAFALGENLIAQSANSFVIGAYNLPEGSRNEWIPSDPLFVIGNGDPGVRSNAFVVLKDGNVVLNQNIREGGGFPLNIAIDGTIVRNTSSSRYKTDIEKIENIEWIYNLEPISFRYRNDQNMNIQYGFIAEDVEAVNKNLVLYRDGKPEGLNYNGLFAPMLKAMRDQRIVIESLSNRTNELIKENDELKERLEKLEETVSSLLRVD